MKRLLLAAPLVLLLWAVACGPKNEETGKATVTPSGGQVDCHVLIIGSKDTTWVKVDGDTLFSTLKPSGAADSVLAADTLHKPRPDLTPCLLADTLHKP